MILGQFQFICIIYAKRWNFAQAKLSNSIQAAKTAANNLNRGFPPMPSITLNFNAEQGARLAAAFQERLNLDELATAEDVKADLIDYLKKVVQIEEREAAQRAFNAAADLELT